MRTRSKLFLIPPAAAALWSVCRLSGLPGAFRLTPFRLLFIALTAGLFLGWLLFFRAAGRLARKEKTRSLIFHGLLLVGCLSLLLFLFPLVVKNAEGMLYQAAAFLRQANPFFLFTTVTAGTGLFVLLRAVGEQDPRPLKLLLTEDGTVPQVLIVFIACMLLFAAYFPLRTNYYPSHDYSIFSYIGQQILRGKIPYTQLWDHKPPLIFYLNALGLKVAGGSLAGIWILEFLAFFLGTLLLLHVLKRFFPTWTALAVLIPGSLHYARLFDFGNYTEEASLFLALCAVWIMFASGKGQRSPWKGLACGLLCGLAFTCKQNTIGAWIGLFLTDLAGLFHEQERRAAFRVRLHFWLMAAAGFLAVNLGWALYFASKDALGAYWDVAFRFNFLYSEQSGANRLATAWTTLTFLPAFSPFLLLGYIGWIFEAVCCGKKGIGAYASGAPLTFTALAGLPFELLFAGLSGMNYQHYFILCIPPLIVLICVLVGKLCARFSWNAMKFRIVIAAVLLIASYPLVNIYRQDYTPRGPSAYTKARDLLLSETVPDRPILVWGSRSAIYVMSERYAPTAYFNERPLYLFPGDVQAEQWEELLSDLKNDPPQVVIYTHDTALPFIAGEGNDCRVPDGAEYTKPVYHYFCENYRYETTINEGFQDAWEVYRLR